jgi:hypothetical protein
MDGPRLATIAGKKNERRGWLRFFSGLQLFEGYEKL